MKLCFNFMMKKIVSFYSILFFFTLGVTHAWALPPCSSNTNAIWDNCVGTYEWTSGEFKGDKYVGEWKKENGGHGKQRTNSKVTNIKAHGKMVKGMVRARISMLMEVNM